MTFPKKRFGRFLCTDVHSIVLGAVLYKPEYKTAPNTRQLLSFLLGWRDGKGVSENVVIAIIMLIKFQLGRYKTKNSAYNWPYVPYEHNLIQPFTTDC